MQFYLLSGLLWVFFSEASPSRISRRQIQVSTCSCYYQNSCGCYCPDRITWEEFQLLPGNFRSCEKFTLAIRGGTFYSFPTDYFTRVESVRDFALDVGDSTFTDLLDSENKGSPFSGVRFDNTAYIRLNNITVRGSWNWGSFNSLTPTLPQAYCEVQVLYSNVPTLTTDFNKICQGAVTVADVMYSGVTTLQDRVFANFRKLNAVDLSVNRLQNMRRSDFPIPALELEKISLAYNNIRTLPGDMFTQMPSLQRVDLTGNPITTLDETTFRQIFPYVQIIGIQNFPLNCDCRIRWLKEPGQQCGSNVYGLAGAICNEPARLRGRSFFNDTLPRDLVC